MTLGGEGEGVRGCLEAIFLNLIDQYYMVCALSGDSEWSGALVMMVWCLSAVVRALAPVGDAMRLCSASV
jgi:hypothetical protein